MKNKTQTQEILARKNFLETKIAELSDKIKYTQMNKHQFEECIDERKEYLKEHKELEETIKNSNDQV